MSNFETFYEKRVKSAEILLEAANRSGLKIHDYGPSPEPFLQALFSNENFDQSKIDSADEHYMQIIGTAEMTRDHRSLKSKSIRFAAYLIHLSNPTVEMDLIDLKDGLSVMLSYVETRALNEWLDPIRRSDFELFYQRISN